VNERLEILDFVCGSGRLDFVVIDHRGQIGQPVLAGAHRGLPDRTFIDFAVSQDNNHTAVALLHANGERHADTDRKTVPESTSRSLYAGHLSSLRMAAKYRVAATERVERLERKETLVGQHDIERDAAMTFAENQAIAVAPSRLQWPKAKDVVVKHA